MAFPFKLHLDWHPLSLAALVEWERNPRLPKIGIITVHGGGRDRREFHRFETFINAAGYEMLLFDYRDHGISEGQGKGMDWGNASYHDVLGAAHFAKHCLQWDKVICLGVSNGAVLTLLAASHDQGNLIDGVVAESPFMSLASGVHDVIDIEAHSYPKMVQLFSLVVIPLVVLLLHFRLGGLMGIPRSSSCLAMIDQIGSRPVLLIHGTADNRFRPSQTIRLFEALKHKDKELWLVEGGKHTEVYDHAPLEYQNKLLTFIRTHFVEPSLART